jgi:hypothetical protein
MRRIAIATVTLVLAGAAGGTARGGFIPAWSYVPAPVRAHLAAASGGTLYLPARVPLFYRYRSGARVSGGTLSVPFTNRVRVREGEWRWTAQSFVWQVRPLPAGTDCIDWLQNEKTMQLDGNKVYTSTANGAVAWRCVTDRSGRMLVLSTTQTGAHAAPFATVVASGLDVSRRTSAINVALTLTPSRVARGGTVLVRGVAGGCTEGDTVTIISQAFSPQHSFAGVPAVFAQVGTAGRVSVQTRIPTARRPGTYVVTARCGGGNLGVAPHLTVTL